MACPNDVCPGTLVCRNQHCVHPDSPNACSSEPPVDTGGQGGQPATGGTGTTPTGGTSMGVGGSAPGSGGTGAGAAGGEAGGPDQLTLDIHPTSLCTGNVSVSLSAGNGREPYSFSIEGNPSGLSLVTDAAGTTLQGTADAAGKVTVAIRVTDADDRSAEKNVTLRINETPVMRSAALPTACPDEKYDAPLEADGGDSDDYTFLIKNIDSEATGLDVRGNRLSGTFKNETGKRATLHLEASVTSGGCESDPVSLELAALASSNPVCPHFGIVGGAPTLPPPCAGNPYEVSFAASGGDTDAYDWALADPPRGFSFDDREQKLKGEPNADGPVVIELTARGGHTIQRSFELPPARDKCWLAYVGPSGDGTRLNLFDPLLGNLRSFPSAAGADPVLDFKFSPDGRFLVYRTGTDANAGRLTLVEMEGFREQEDLDFENVTRYSWSDRSPLLGVGFGDGADSFFGGVDVSGDGGAGMTAEYPSVTPVTLPVTTPLMSDPVWFPDSNVGFLTIPYDYLELMWTSRTDQGFSDVNFPDDATFAEGSFVRTSPGGVFIIPDKDHKIAYYPNDGSDTVLHDEVLISPNGTFAAKAEDGVLEVFKPDNHSYSTKPDVVPDGSQAGCDAVLAWTRSGTRLACARTRGDDANLADLVIFDIATDATIALQTVQGDYAFPAPGRTGLKRVFSQSGQRIAFATNDALYSATTAVNAMSVDTTVSYQSDPGADVALAFSPDQRFLAEHRRTKLRLLDFTTFPTTAYDITRQEDVLPTAPACSEDLRAPATLASGTAYCGEVAERASFAWSPDSRLLAIATAAGDLLVEDLRFDGQFLPIAAPTSCAATCRAGDEFAFQP